MCTFGNWPYTLRTSLLSSSSLIGNGGGVAGVTAAVAINRGPHTAVHGSDVIALTDGVAINDRVDPHTNDRSIYTRRPMVNIYEWLCHSTTLIIVDNIHKSSLFVILHINPYPNLPIAYIITILSYAMIISLFAQNFVRYEETP